MTAIKPAFEKVMVIDDTAIDMYISLRILSKNHFVNNPLEYNNAIDALQYLQDNQHISSMLPDIIFIDIYMPLMSGFEFMEAYEKLHDTLKNKCRVFIISSTSDARDIARIESDKNVTAFNQKPITNEFLQQIINGYHP